MIFHPTEDITGPLAITAEVLRWQRMETDARLVTITASLLRAWQTTTFPTYDLRVSKEEANPSHNRLRPHECGFDVDGDSFYNRNDEKDYPVGHENRVPQGAMAISLKREFERLSVALRWHGKTIEADVIRSTARLVDAWNLRSSYHFQAHVAYEGQACVVMAKATAGRKELPMT